MDTVGVFPKPLVSYSDRRALRTVTDNVDRVSIATDYCPDQLIAEPTGGPIITGAVRTPRNASAAVAAAAISLPVLGEPSSCAVGRPAGPALCHDEIGHQLIAFRLGAEQPSKHAEGAAPNVLTRDRRQARGSAHPRDARAFLRVPRQPCPHPAYHAIKR